MEFIEFFVKKNVNIETSRRNNYMEFVIGDKGRAKLMRDWNFT